MHTEHLISKKPPDNRLVAAPEGTTLWWLMCGRWPILVVVLWREVGLYTVTQLMHSECGRICRGPYIEGDYRTTKIEEFVCPPNISETVAVRIMKLAHRPRIASTAIKLISKHVVLSILLILVKKTIQRIGNDPNRTPSPPFDSPDSVPSLGHPASTSDDR